MTFLVPEDLRFPTPTSKAHLEHCGKFFCSNLERSFSEIAKKTGGFIDTKISTATAFNEKQVLHDLKKRMVNEVGKLTQTFRNKIESELNNQLSLDYRLHGKPIWWKPLTDINKQDISYKDFIQKFEESLGSGYYEDCLTLKKRINCITGVDQEIFGANVIVKALISTLKETINSPTSLYYGTLFFGNVWAQDIHKIIAGMNKYLIENNVVVNISEYDEIFKGIKQLPKSWGWEKEGSYVDKETVSRTTVYGSMAVPVNLDLPSLNDFLSGKTTKVEEHTAIPRFEPTKKEEKPTEISNFSVNNEETKVKLEDEIKPSINKVMENIDTTVIENIGENEKNIFSWIDYLSKVERILKIQTKNIRSIDINKLSFADVRNYEIKSTESLLAENESFIELSTNLQKKFRRIDFFQDNEETMGTNIFEEFTKEDTEELKVSEFDRFVCNFLGSIFQKILSSSNLSLLSKSLFYKLQIPLWHKIITDKGFFTTKDNSTRILLDLLTTNEVIYNIALLEKIEELVSSSKYRFKNVSSYFNGLTDEILSMIETQNSKENNLLKEVTDEYQLATNKNELYRLVTKTIKTNIDRTSYEPVKSFIEKIWAKSFVNKYHDSLDCKFTTIDGILKQLNIAAKLNWQQSMVAFESIILIANNEDNTPVKISKMRELLSKANSVLPKICVELGIDTNYMKALLSLLKYRIDSYSKTANEFMLNELMLKIKPNEDMYITASDEYSKTLWNSNSINIENGDIVNPIKLTLSLNSWYLINHEHMKLKYSTHDNEFMFFMLSRDIFSTESFSKSKINTYYKNKEAHLLEEHNAIGSFTCIMLDACKEFQEKLK